MTLSFDPSAVLAQGGIMHGFDNLGAAVMNAMNSREARRAAATAAATRAAAEESQFSRQLAGQSERQKAGDVAAMDRTKTTQQGEFVRKATGELGATGRTVISTGGRLVDSVLDYLKPAGRSSASKDGAVDEEKMVRDLMKNADAAAIKGVPSNQLAELEDAGDPSHPYAASLGKQRDVYRQDFYKKAGYALDPKTGQLVKAVGSPQVAAPKPAAAPLSSGLAAKYRAKFPSSASSKLDDATLEKLLTERKWSGN